MENRESYLACYALCRTVIQLLITMFSRIKETKNNGIGTKVLNYSEMFGGLKWEMLFASTYLNIIVFSE